MDKTRSRTVTALRYLSVSEVAAMVGLHVRTIQRWARTGEQPDFPEPRLVGANVRRWLSSEIEEWMLRRPAQGEVKLRPAPGGSKKTVRRGKAKAIASPSRGGATRQPARPLGGPAELDR